MLTMEEAMKQTGTMPFAAGNIVKGHIIEVRPKEVLVDIGYKSEGVISGAEFDDIKTVKVGDEIDVLIEKLEDKEGMVVLSKEKAEFKKNWSAFSRSATKAAPSPAKSKRSSKAVWWSISGSRPFCRRRRSTSLLPRISPNTWATPTISRWLRSTRSGRTSFCPAANSSNRNGWNAARNCSPK